jgi:rRNA maturation endonuclease Nob1|tara:strand:+ start:341 stop:634 length:294 start_codon:yes stop_codon:yes gene_type:complete
MATKGTNAKIKELKNSKPEKITPEDMGKLQVAVSGMNKVYLELGRYAAASHASLHSLAGMQEEMMRLQDDLEKTYGTGDINVQNGTINYDKDVKADS